MFVGRINKQNPDVSRFTVDLTDWLDDGETATNILTHTITLGTTGWSNTPFPVPGAPPPYDPTPLMFTEVKLVDGGTGVEVYVSFGTPGNVYTCQFEVAGTTLREVTFEVGVQISGQPPAAVPVVTQPIPLDALSIYGGTMLGPLYLFRDPTYPTEAATKQYADWVVSQLQVSTKVNRSGDTMGGFLSLYADPVQPLQAATKNYVDVQTGSTLHDAPSDGFYYGRRSLSWAKVTEEAPTNVYGYLRSNGAWVRGVPQVGVTQIDVRVTDGNAANTPYLTGMLTPFSAATDLFMLAARRTSTGVAGDGGLIQLTGPTYSSAPNAVTILTGTRAATKGWLFDQAGTLSAPGHVVATGQVRSDTGRVLSLTRDGTTPTVLAYDVLHSVASGFWVDTAGIIHLGSADGNGSPVTSWTSVSSTGIATGSLSTTANVSVGTSLSVGGNLNVTGAVGISGLLTATNLAVPGDIASNTLHTNQINVTGSIESKAIITGADVHATGTLSADTDVFASGSVAAGGTLFASGQNMVFGNGGSGRIMQAQGGYYFDFNTATGQMSWVGNNGTMWVMRANDALCFNQAYTVGGQGPYVNLLSSGAMKTDIVEASHGLAEVLRLVPKTFRHAARPEHLHLGFVIEDVQSVIPEAVTRFEGLEPGTTMKGISDTPILAAAVNAIKAMNARIATLEARLLRE
jgi:hypothetical protein